MDMTILPWSYSLMLLDVLLMALAQVSFPEARPEQSPPAQNVPDDKLADIVVTARKGTPPAKLDAIGYYRRYCFDANRLTRKSAPPFDDPDWEPLGDLTRSQFDISDPDTPAFSLVDPDHGGTLLLKFETFSRPGNLVENRCTLVVIGGYDHEALPGRLSAVFRGPGTQRQIGHRDGTERVKGWDQWLWTGMPGRRSKSWQTINGEGRRAPGGTWVVVTDLSFYADHDYILGDLKTRRGDGQPISVISFAYTTTAQRKR